jgi:hypothetical protein
MKINKPQMWTISISLLAMALFVFLYFSLVNLPKSLDGQTHCDFPNYYFAGLRLWHGQPVYTDVADDVLKLLGYPIGYKVYPADPPFTVAVLSFYSFLPYQWAWGINILFSLILLVAVTGISCRLCRYSLPASIIFISAALVSHPFLYLISRNHYEVILGLLGLLGWNAFRNGRSWSGGFYWGLAAGLKLFPAFWFFALPAYLGWKAFLRALFFFLLFSALGFFLLGIDNSLDYVFRIIPKSRLWYGTAGNYSFISFFYALKIPWPGWFLAVSAFIIGTYTSIFKKSSFTHAWVNLVVLSLLISPLSWLNYLVILLPIMIMLKTGIDKLPEFIIFGLLVLSLFFSPADIIKTDHLLSTVLLSSIPMFGLFGLWIYTFIKRKTLFDNFDSNGVTNIIR